MAKNNKYYLQCKSCGNKLNDLSEWFEVKQHCPECGSPEVDVWYHNGMDGVVELIKDKSFKPDSLWGYFDYLPLLDKSNIVSNGREGVVPIDRWAFLEDFAKSTYNKNIKVYAHRHDQNHATGTFKDLAGTVAASVLKELNIQNFVGASTGNIGVAYSRYLAAAGVNLYLFIPGISLPRQESEIGSYGQNVIRTNEDYAGAKKMSKEFAEKNNFLLTGGNFCPMRLEAKKTMVYEWLRLLPDFPTVFMQAISGGSGPIGVDKACRELKDSSLFSGVPRFILPQPHRCAPMAEAWEKAKASGFPEGWLNDYPVYENPETTINTLSTGNPTAYPCMANIVRQTNGEIISSVEEYAIDVSRLIAYETTVRIGPAAAITAVGFFQSLREGTIKDGDVVMLNIGEGVNRSPQFMDKFSYSTQKVTDVNQCNLVERKQFKKQLYDAVGEI